MICDFCSELNFHSLEHTTESGDREMQSLGGSLCVAADTRLCLPLDCSLPGESWHSVLAGAILTLTWIWNFMYCQLPLP